MGSCIPTRSASSRPIAGPLPLTCAPCNSAATLPSPSSLPMTEHNWKPPPNEPYSPRSPQPHPTAGVRHRVDRSSLQRLRRVSQHPTILLLLSFWLFVLARLISGLFSAYHG